MPKKVAITVGGDATDLERSIREAIDMAQGAGASLAQIAGAAGVTTAVVSRFVSGERTDISMRTAGKLMSVLGLEIAKNPLFSRLADVYRDRRKK